MKPSIRAQSAMLAVNEFLGEGPQRTIHIAMIAFVFLQCLDLLTTLAAFAHGGVELNPLVRSLMPFTGEVMAIVASKLLLISLVFLLSQRKRILYFGNILYSAIVVWNLGIVLALR